MLLYGLCESFGTPTMFFHLSPRSQSMGLHHVQDFGSRWLELLYNKVYFPRCKGSVWGFPQVPPTVLVAEIYTKRKNKTLLHFHGVSWLVDPQRKRCGREMLRQCKCTMRRQGFTGSPVVELEPFDAQRIANAFEYLSKNTTDDAMSVVIDPFSRATPSERETNRLCEQFAVA